MSYVFHPAAEAEHLETIAYYESQGPGVGARYLAEFEHALHRVCEAPRRYPIVREPDVRRIRLRKFPFSVLYAKGTAVSKSSRWPTIVAALSTG